MSILVISTSLNPESRSATLASEACRLLAEKKQEHELVDLRKHELPLCDGKAAYGHPNVALLKSKIEKAGLVLFACPIYNYDCGSAGKNLIELTGTSWEDKTVGFLCAAGGKSSYMSIMALANSLMLDFRCLILPRFVYADGSSFAGSGLIDKEIEKRIGDLVESAIKMQSAISALSAAASK